MRISTTLLVVALLAACASDDPQNGSSELALDFETLPSAPGEEVSLILRNGSDFQVSYNLCASRLSHQSGEEWVSGGLLGECTMERETLEAGGEDSYEFALPEELDGGNYRIIARVEVDGSRTEEVYSPTFQMPEPMPQDTTEAEAEGPPS